MGVPFTFCSLGLLLLQRQGAAGLILKQASVKISIKPIFTQLVTLSLKYLSFSKRIFPNLVSSLNPTCFYFYSDFEA